MSQIRFLDNTAVGSFGSTSADAVITASANDKGILFTKGNNEQFLVPIATSASSADSLTTASVSNNTITFTKGNGTTFPVTIDTGSGGGTNVIANPGGTGLPSLTTIGINGTDFAISGSGGGGSDITFQSNPAQIIGDIDVQNFDPNVAVSFTGNKLKFVFGTPTAPTPSFSSLSGFNQNRFNKVFDTYNLIGTFSIGGYDLISASMFETTGGGNILIQNVGSGNGFNISQNTTGSVSYQMQVTASSPMDGSIYSQSFDRSGTLSKSPPAIPTIAYTPNVQLGAASNEIELGATGSITFVESAGAANGWVFVPGTLTTNVPSPIIVTESDTSDILISASAAYSSSGVDGSDNDPAETTSVTSATKTYSRIRSLRYGTSANASFTYNELLDIESWDASLGGTIGTIDKGKNTQVEINNTTINITWTGLLYQYVIYDASLPDLTSFEVAGNNYIGAFESPVTVGGYKIWRTTNKLYAAPGGLIQQYKLIF